jgi:hypothetical protein
VGGQNDVATNGYSSAQCQAAVTLALNNVRTTWPNALVICVGPFYNQPTVATFDVVRTDIMAACAAASPAVAYVDTQGWVTGAGYSGGSNLPTATAILTAGAVSGFSITNAGAGLTQAPRCKFGLLTGPGTALRLTPQSQRVLSTPSSWTRETLIPRSANRATK